VTQTLFWAVLAAISPNLATIALSIARPDLRVWPPPRRDSWQFVYNGVVTFTSLLGFLALGILDGNSFGLQGSVRWVVGGLLMACGFFALWGYLTLGAHASRGLGEELVTTGPYRYSRNPQYVGTIPAILGYAILCNSSLALVVSLPLMASFVLVPFAEESWCRENLGDAYEKYAAKVPRFLGVRDIRAAKEDR
jgi:protein-S-isoprenylcysteine O-methyltransferase Ste14